MIYLAGKVRGKKWEMAKRLCPHLEFTATDGSNHSEHLWGLAYYDLESWVGSNRNGGKTKWGDDSIEGYGDRCKGLLAYVNESTSFGTIAEIGYFSAKELPCRIVFDMSEYSHSDECRVRLERLEELRSRVEDLFSKQGDETYESKEYKELLLESGETEARILVCPACNSNDEFFDRYWFASQLPFVDGKVCYTSEDADKAFKQFAYELVGPQSPIERKVYAALFDKLDIFPQFPLGRYRIDLAIPSSRIAIECDGFEHHHTKEQQSKDAARQREITENGFVFLRFSGSEIHRDLDSCISQILRVHRSRVSGGAR